MKLLNYKFQEGLETGWKFSEIELGRFNLFVGDTATGKSKLLNTMFNLGASAVRTPSELKIGRWDVTFSQENVTYTWEFETYKDKKGEAKILNDNISQLNEHGDSFRLVTRNEDSFIYKNQELPRLPLTETSISLLKEEPEIRPIYDGFSSILRRMFSQDALMKVVNYSSVSSQVFNELDQKKSTKDLYKFDLGLNANLYLLSEIFPKTYKQICTIYRQWFPFIHDESILDFTEIHKSFSSPSKIPVFCIKENGVDDWIELSQLSSGMQKVLLILTDLLAYQDSGIYLIDEYENSLGPSVLDFLPEVLDEINESMQIIVTSHHPYLIKKIPISEWYVFHRKGQKVSIRHGDELIERYSGSNQDKYIQLINDSFYTEGVE
jgi:predicted ATPase